MKLKLWLNNCFFETKFIQDQSVNGKNNIELFLKWGGQGPIQGDRNNCLKCRRSEEMAETYDEISPEEQQ